MIWCYIDFCWQWLSRLQVVILSRSVNHISYNQNIYREFWAEGLRTPQGRGTILDCRIKKHYMLQVQILVTVRWLKNDALGNLLNLFTLLFLIFVNKCEHIKWPSSQESILHTTSIHVIRQQYWTKKKYQFQTISFDSMTIGRTKRMS